MKQILVVVHQTTSNPGLVGKLLQQAGYGLDIRIPSVGQELPVSLDNHQAVVVFGGPMSANDDQTLPHIRTELDWIPTAITSAKPFLGICLGAQLLARVLGAKVVRHPQGIREIGYFPITSTPEGKADFAQLKQVYQWHQEGFELPPETVKLASGELFPNQAFRYGKNAYGLQFHPEMTEEMIKFWTTNGADQLTLPGAQSVAEQLEKHICYSKEREEWLQNFLNNWLNKYR